MSNLRFRTRKAMKKAKEKEMAQDALSFEHPNPTPPPAPSHCPKAEAEAEAAKTTRETPPKGALYVVDTKKDEPQPSGERGQFDLEDYEGVAPDQSATNDTTSTEEDEMQEENEGATEAAPETEAEVTHTPDDYPLHPLAEIIPPMTEDEFQSLKEDIAAVGQIDAITLMDGMVLDGRHRLRACRELGIDPQFAEMDGATEEHAVNFVRSVNTKRRNLNKSQLAMVGAALAKYSGMGVEEAANEVGISTRGIREGKAVIDGSADEVKDAVKEGRIAVSDAAKVAGESHDDQREALAKVDATEGKTTLAREIAPKKTEREKREAKDKATRAVLDKAAKAIRSFNKPEQKRFAPEIEGLVNALFDTAILEMPAE